MYQKTLSYYITMLYRSFAGFTGDKLQEVGLNFGLLFFIVYIAISITSTPFDAYIYLIRFEYVISQQIYALFICLHFPGGCAIMGKVSKNTGVCHEQNA